MKSGNDALEKLRLAFFKIDDSLNRAVRAKDDSAVAQVANNINLKIYQALPILGFLLRSTNVRNAFELIEPLQSIAKQTMQGTPALILSSEWDYVPFAYPQSLDDLKSFVLIGLPASEAATALLVPIAGHEIGHAVWRNRGIEGSVAATIQVHCEALYAHNAARFKRAFPEYIESDIVAREILPEAIAQSVEYAVRQSEELFCDLLAYSVFGPSYVHAFTYLLAPGTGEVDARYPLNQTRVIVIQKIAKDEGVIIPNFKDLGFLSEARRGDHRHKFIVEMAETSVEKIIPGIWASVSKIVDKNVTRPDETRARHHLRDFKVGVPAASPICIGDIINAGWLYHGEIISSEKNPDVVSERLYLLNEVLLKTIEVLEFNKRTQ